MITAQYLDGTFSNEGKIMKEYYSERNGLLNKDFTINLNQLREMFLFTYEYFYNKKAVTTF